MTQQVKIITLMLCLLILGISVLGNVRSAYASDNGSIKTYTKQHINVNKIYTRPHISHAIDLDELPQIKASDLEQKQEIETSPQEAIIIEPAAGTMSVNEEIKLDSLDDLKRIPEIAQDEDLTIEVITEDILSAEGNAVENIEIIAVEENQDVITNTAYALGADDKIKITVYGEKDMSGEFKVTSDGSISLPLIGVVNMLDKSPRDAEILIADKLRDGYLKNPSVSVEVIESRPFYIMGEVRSPGSYSYVNGMNILQAVAISGGFTYRANRKSIEVTRRAKKSSDPVKMSPTQDIKPGDIIYVRERFF